MAPSQREPPLPFAVWPWGLFPAALQPVWVQDINHGSPLHPLLLVVPDDRMILMEWTDFWKKKLIKISPLSWVPKLQFQFKNLGHLSLKFRNCYSTLSCRLILYKIWHCFQAEYVHHADAPSQKTELLHALCRAFITFILQYYLSSIHAINTEMREHNDSEAICSLLLSLRQPYLSERFFALPPLTKAPVSG